MARNSTPVRTLALSHVAYTYPGAAEPVLHNVSVTFPVGWTGIVGDNGCGKSTLARVACRLLTPDAGAVTGPVACAYCEQDPSLPPTRLEDFACDYGAEAIRLRTELGIEDDMPWRFAELSFGEQKKLQVAVALWSNADVLVLDEPTNHVDAHTRREIIKSCASYRGIGLVISHDRELLDTLARQCLRFEGAGHSGTAQRLTMRAGGYTQGNTTATVEQQNAQHTREQALREHKRLIAEQQAREVAAARTAKRRSAHSLDKHDSDGRAKRALAIVSGQDGKRGKLAGRMTTRVERATNVLASTKVDKRYDGNLWLETEPHPRPVLMQIPAGEISCGSHGKLALPNLYLGSRDHIGISGPNGAGKSTFIHHLIRMMPDDADALVIPQELSDIERNRFLAHIRGLDTGSQGQLLSLVAQLNSDPKRILTSCINGDANPSPGELRKLMLADGVLRTCPLIIMDEPTNHLDLHSIEALEAALSAFPGALVLVSHDAHFLAACTNRRWHIEDGCVQEI